MGILAFVCKLLEVNGSHYLFCLRLLFDKSNVFISNKVFIYRLAISKLQCTFYFIREA